LTDVIVGAKKPAIRIAIEIGNYSKWENEDK
jgi:hypothetical protein